MFDVVIGFGDKGSRVGYTWPVVAGRACPAFPRSTARELQQSQGTPDSRPPAVPGPQRLTAAGSHVEA